VLIRHIAESHHLYGLQVYLLDSDLFPSGQTYHENKPLIKKVTIFTRYLFKYSIISAWNRYKPRPTDLTSSICVGPTTERIKFSFSKMWDCGTCRTRLQPVLKAQICSHITIRTKEEEEGEELPAESAINVAKDLATGRRRRRGSM
jgi:hypothetical protein